MKKFSILTLIIFISCGSESATTVQDTMTTTESQETTTTTVQDTTTTTVPETTTTTAQETTTTIAVSTSPSKKLEDTLSYSDFKAVA